MNKQGSGIGPSVALVWLCSVAPLAAILVPLLLPVYQQSYALDASAMGLLASADLAGACLASISAPLWLQRTGCRGGVIGGLMVVATANIAAAFAGTSLLLLTTRLVAGVGTGLVLSSAIPIVSASQRPARLISAVQVLQLLLAGAALAGAGQLLAAAGPRPVLLAVVAIAVLSLPAAMLLPGRSGQAHSLPTLAEMRPVSLILGGIFIYFAAAAIISNYAGQLSTQQGLSIEAVSTALAVGNLGALPGSLIAMLATTPEHRRLMMVAAAGLQCLAVAVMLWVPGALVFTSAFFLVQMCITILGPLQVAALVDRDASGRGIEGLAAMQSGGQALGPLLGALFISGGRVDGAYLCGFAIVVVSTAMVVRRRSAIR
ncbi:MFS transporter [Nitrospirillum amazonense]|uniref:MFS transporter n=1 Tax=Nitrospirillum amazonense TaxID=28077 RepID=UPI002412C0F3|nr:MFS transporter [Nitrospirillum amazonense]MDG3439262.1 hypothetical protein [Nitrospirillum amazonense]